MNAPSDNSANPRHPVPMKAEDGMAVPGTAAATDGLAVTGTTAGTGDAIATTDTVATDSYEVTGTVVVTDDTAATSPPAATGNPADKPPNNPAPKSPVTPSVFHAGEQAIQRRNGLLDRMAQFGRMAIRPYMPDQHRQFFEQLPFVVLGSVDPDGWPWASILAGGKGFLSSPDPKRLDVDLQPSPQDPLTTALAAGAPIGVLGIELGTRRRNRMNARVIDVNRDGFSLAVSQSFGNCPQYIQTQDLRFVRAPKAPVEHAAAQGFEVLDDAAIEAIESSNSFFVSSYIDGKDNLSNEGVDVSHRGGRPGFVKVVGNTLTIPDYSGNKFFNTLGNFLINPKAGLTFPDYTRGDLLMLTGTVELLAEDHPEVRAFEGAERGWRFTLDHGLRLPDALPFRATLTQWSPNSLLAGDWARAEARLKAEAQRSLWQWMQVSKMKDESSVIRSFTLVSQDGSPPLRYEAGQFLTLRVRPKGATTPLIRSYTLSSAPSDPAYRISVKREAGGVVSTYLHDHLQPGDLVEVKAASGVFTLDASEKRPAVLLAGGVGVTPMISMARQVIYEGKRTRYQRVLTIFHATQDSQQRGFNAEFRRLEALSQGALRYFTFVAEPGADESQGVDFNGTGYISAEALQQVLPLADYDFYLCGPAPFMQAIYDMLRGLGVQDRRIFSESFGPAALQRGPELVALPDSEAQEAEMAVVRFAASGFEQRWSRGDATLLETAEAHGLAVNFSCRSGSCGSCRTRKLAGNVSYRRQPTADHSEDEVLLCCAVPAQGTEVLELDL